MYARRHSTQPFPLALTHHKYCITIILCYSSSSSSPCSSSSSSSFPSSSSSFFLLSPCFSSFLFFHPPLLPQACLFSPIFSIVPPLNLTHILCPSYFCPVYSSSTPVPASLCSSCCWFFNPPLHHSFSVYHSILLQHPLYYILTSLQEQSTRSTSGVDHLRYNP